MMKFLKIFFVAAFVSLAMVACKNEAKKEEAPKTEEVAANVQEASFAISGMTCEIGCAKKIASDLNKKEGVLEANVIFNDSIANVKFDANKTNKAELMAFVNGINEAYKTSEISKEACKADCKMECCANKTDAEKTACEKECCAKTETEKKACATDCEKPCCAETKKA
ncbi:cation transporter [Tenacibaculum caenipelagi]|uniref:Heavy-metal-associated domain-containing protein n=1 Tax=Tenacibaculum caenipelagi TaxID=1325435 RepID=A0A4R6THU9_9FLAO|nr:heavy-metal-associated domain-containing protein [Tenacibaculum caenipelagi]TDQ28766.1 heavy-metal-associated domain-containing protein [Tenacibaculum caenipelagi]